MPKFIVRKHVMRDGKIHEPGAELDDLSADEVANLMREQCVEPVAAPQPHAPPVEEPEQSEPPQEPAEAASHAEHKPRRKRA